jgi:Pyridoxamine 5'-phosphate oxidase
MLSLPAASAGHALGPFTAAPGAFVIRLFYNKPHFSLHSVVYFAPMAAIVPALRPSAPAQSKPVVYPLSAGGRLLPSNVALEFSLQYECVVVYGSVQVLEDFAEKRRALYGLIGKYFPAMAAGREFRPIADQELKRTSVYLIQIESWSGKRNWAERADQSDEWPPLAEEWFR